MVKNSADPSAAPMTPPDYGVVYRAPNPIIRSDDPRLRWVKLQLLQELPELTGIQINTAAYAALAAIDRMAHEDRLVVKHQHPNGVYTPILGPCPVPAPKVVRNQPSSVQSPKK